MQAHSAETGKLGLQLLRFALGEHNRKMRLIDYRLLYSAATGSLHGAKKAIEHGANVNAIGILELTPLHLASASLNTEMVFLLTSHGATPNSKGINKLTPSDLAGLEYAELECYGEPTEQDDIALEQILAILHGEDIDAPAENSFKPPALERQIQFDSSCLSKRSPIRVLP